MPSQEPLPTIQQFLEAFHTGAGLKDQEADSHEGAWYDHVGGPAALLWRRLSERTRAGFRENYQAHASRRLDQHLTTRYGRARVEDTPGTGTITVSRPTDAGGEGWFRVGTRFFVGQGAERAKTYQVAQDTHAGPTALEATVPIAATEPGPAGEVSDADHLAWRDTLWDNTWSIDSITCGPGTLRESDADYLDSVRDLRFTERPGHIAKIEAVLRENGATVVEFFRSDFLGDASDQGLNYAVVGDEGFEATEEMLRNCRLALDGVAIAGTALQVVPMTRVVLGVTITVRLFDLPERFDTVGVREAGRASVLEYFRSRENPFIWQVSAIRGAVYRAVRNISEVAIETTVAEPTLSGLFLDPPVQRFVAEESTVNLHVLGPAS